MRQLHRLIYRVIGCKENVIEPYEIWEAQQILYEKEGISTLRISQVTDLWINKDKLEEANKHKQVIYAPFKYLGYRVYATCKGWPNSEDYLLY